MKDTLQNIKERRSCRKFSERQIEPEQLDAILEAGTWAATGRGMQSPIMVVVQDKPTLEKLSKLNAAILGVQSDPFYGAPTAVIVLADKGRPTCVEDGSLVMGNLMLAAHALGVGSCWIHRAGETFDQPEWKEWLASLGLTGDYEGIGNCILGYTDGDEPVAAPRKEGRVFYSE